jgi:putative membrane protein
MPAIRSTDDALDTRSLLRSAMGGVLMGLANLVPGISGGTMLLAAGVYTDFIDAIAGITRLRPTRSMLITLATVGGAAAIAILLFAGTIRDLVVDHRWIMYSLFIGLTLGGVPTLWRMARPASRPLWLGAGAGFVAMAVLALAQQSGAGAGGAGSDSFLMLLIAGTGGAASMILPGISGGYILLVLGQYVPILSAIDRATDAMRAADLAAMLEPAFGVFLPVGLGLLLGIAAVSNLLRTLLQRHQAATLGVLLGLLLGCVVGLWPFQQGVPPEPGDFVKGQVVTAQSAGEIDAEDWPVVRFSPTAGQVAGSAALIVLGGLVTLGIARIGARD